MINKETWNEKHIRLMLAFPPGNGEPIWYQIRYDGKIKEYSKTDFYSMSTSLISQYESGRKRSIEKRKEAQIGSKE
jgi:hypothetical protein